MSKISYAIGLIAICVLWASSTYFVASRLTMAMDISDTAYYIISYSQHSDIESQSTLFGPVWDIISPYDGILNNRYVALAFLELSFALLAVSAAASMGSIRLRWFDTAAFALLAATGSLFFLGQWLPDPSYNTLNLGLTALGWAGLLFLLRATRGGNWLKMAIGALLIGLVIAAIAFTKITSAALLGPTLLAVFLVQAWRSLNAQRLLVLLVGSLAGIGAAFGAMTGVGFGPSRIFETMQNGYSAAILIAEPPLNALSAAGHYVEYLVGMPLLRTWYFPLVLIGFAIVFSDRLAGRFRVQQWARVAGAGGLSLVFTGLLYVFGGYVPIESLLNTCVLLALALAWVGSANAAPGRRAFLVAFWVAMAASLIIYSYGSGSSWQKHFVNASGFAWASLGAMLFVIRPDRRALFGIPALALLALGLTATAVRVEQFPYRMDAPLAALTTPAQIGPYGETFYVSDKLGQFYNKLEAVRAQIERLPEPPLLLDLTGRTPMVAYQIGAHIPRTPWLLSAYPGSAAVFDLTVGKIAPETIKGAWIFHSADYVNRLPDDILAKFGLSFPQDYIAVTTVPIPYIKASGTLYAPKAEMQTILSGPQVDVR